jgi:tetratricopeptide (TPR) repeat protein
MYELLAGHKPFEAETMHSVLFQVLDQEPQPLRKWIPDMPMPVAHVVEKALAKDPKMRYQTAGEMRGGLRNARRVMAAGRAAEAALGGPTALAEAEATLTRGPAVPATYVSTDARDWGVTGATALNLRPAKDAEAPTTERPDPTMLEAVEEPPPSRAGVYAVGALVALIAVGAGTFAWIRTRTAPQVDPAELAKEQEAIIREQLVAGQVELAQTELANKSYAAAVAQADRVLGLDAGNAVAAEVKKRAEAALREVEAAAAAARSAFAKGDTAGATESLKRLMTMDPSHAAVTELSTALNRHFEAQAKDARGVAQASRAEAQRLRATAFDGFAAGDRLASAAEAKLGSRDFAEATQKFLEASEGYGRARRAAEAAEVAARKAAAVPSSLPSSSARPPSSSPSGVASITPSLPPVTTTSPSTLPVSPTPSAVTTAPSVGISPAPSASASAAGPDPAIRRAIADWGRAIETKDMALFKHVWPGLTGDQEKALRDSFKNVKSQQVALSVEGVDVKGSTATVRISRQDTVNGQQQKPRQHTVRMSQRPSGWVIESLGQ